MHSSRTFFRNQGGFPWTLFLCTVLLAVIGVINLYSATSVVKESLRELYIQQVYWLVAGGLVASLVASIDYHHYERLAYVFYGLGLILILIVLAFGRDIRGGSRWIYLGPVGLQPSEFMKLFLIFALAKYLHNDPRHDKRSLRDLLLPTLLCALPFFFILKQPDLGTALIHGLIFLSIVGLLQIHLRSLLLLFTGSIVLLPTTWVYVLKEYQKKRIVSFLNPSANLLSSNWHAHHARVAIGNGGLLGEGFANGTQNQFLFLPDQYSDFPFAVFAEDWGFVGCTVLLSLYALLVLCAIRIAATARDRFGAVLAIGVGALIFWQAFFNLGMVIGILPVVGVTLPLFSSGGSSILTTLTGIGLLMNISMQRYSTGKMP